MTGKPEPVFIPLKKSREAGGGEDKAAPSQPSRKGQAEGPADKPAR